MAKNCDKITAAMKELGCTGRRITKESILARIEDVEYTTTVLAGQKLMFCGIRMKGGFVVVGKPATCIDPSNWRDEIGMQISYDNSFEELWKLEAYRTLSVVDLVDVAKTCHEVNKAYCEAYGDMSQPSWEDAPDWQKESAINNVLFHRDNPHAGPDASHQNWYNEKADAGWVYGEVKDPEKKEHPCMVHYSDLPVAQRAKDYIFRQTVHSMLNLE